MRGEEENERFIGGIQRRGLFPVATKLSVWLATRYYEGITRARDDMRMCARTHTHGAIIAVSHGKGSKGALISDNITMAAPVIITSFDCDVAKVVALTKADKSRVSSAKINPTQVRHT